jgi:hypothetical protein
MVSNGDADIPGHLAACWRSEREMTTGDEFVEFAAAASPRLRRMAFLLCGDWHTAEDLAPTALAKVFVSWRKVRRQPWRMRAFCAWNSASVSTPTALSSPRWVSWASVSPTGAAG